MSNQLLLADIETLRVRTRESIRNTVIPAEPRPGERLEQATREWLQSEAEAAGVFAPHVPKVFGGQGVPIEYWSPIFQVAGYPPIGPPALNCLAPDEVIMHLLDLFATDAQKQRHLAPLAAGTSRSCVGMTAPHPGAGSDPATLLTKASKVDAGWSIDGHKRFISGADEAASCIVIAGNETAGSFPAEATTFLVDMDNPGVRLGEHIHTIDRAIDGGHPHASFDSYFVPDEAVLGEVGLGFKYAQVRLSPARLTHCMRWLGRARRALDIALDRTERRELFGSPMKKLGLAQELIAQSVIHPVIARAIQLCDGDGVSDRVPLSSYLNKVRPLRIRDGAIETHERALSRRPSARRKAAVDAGEPCLAEMCSELAGVH